MKISPKFLILLIPMLILGCGRKDVPEAEDRVIRALEQSYFKFNTIAEGEQAYRDKMALTRSNFYPASSPKSHNLTTIEFIAEHKRLQRIEDQGIAAQKIVASNFETIKGWIGTEWTGEDETKANIISIVNQDVTDELNTCILRSSTKSEIRDILKLYRVSTKP